MSRYARSLVFVGMLSSHYNGIISGVAEFKGSSVRSHRSLSNRSYRSYQMGNQRIFLDLQPFSRSPWGSKARTESQVGNISLECHFRLGILKCLRHRRRRFRLGSLNKALYFQFLDTSILVDRPYSSQQL